MIKILIEFCCLRILSELKYFFLKRRQFSSKYDPDKENKTMDQKIHPVLNSGKPPTMAAVKPPAVVMITPGVNHLSLVIIPFIVKEMIERLFVLLAILIRCKR
jgi:hypothetical protein